MGIGDVLKKVDAFPKTLDDFRVRTSSGAAVSVCAILLMLLLFTSEVAYFFTTETVEFTDVDSKRDGKLRINFDITFPSMACGVVHLDAMDVGGKHQLDVEHNVHKTRLDSSGKRFGGSEVNELKQTVTTQDELLALANKKKAGDGSGDGSSDGDDHGHDHEKEQAAPPVPKDPRDTDHGTPGCGSCYGAGAEGQCCSTCEEIRELYRKKGWAFRPNHMAQCQKEGFVRSLQTEAGEGCQITGYVTVPKVAGNIHFAPGKSFQHAANHVHDLVQFTVGEFNITHRINQLSFGRVYPNMKNPLDGYGYVQDGKSGMYQYFLKIVPTEYKYRTGVVVDTNQFSATDHMRKLDSRSGRGLPGVFIFYEISPIRVHIQRKHKSFWSFLTSCCAIIGGVFTIMGLVDKLLHKLLLQRNSSASDVLKSL